jgi:hypothetical protein
VKIKTSLSKTDLKHNLNFSMKSSTIGHYMPISIPIPIPYTKRQLQIFD